MKSLIALAVVTGAFLAGLLGALPGLGWLFGVVIPYLAIAVFLGGLVYRVVRWARVPVPFPIATTCGQQQSLAWIKPQRFENPYNAASVVGRMALEVLGFRSLLRNTHAQMIGERRLVYGTDLGLWLGAIVMHWSLLIILIRHLRLFIQPVPFFVTFIERVDGFLDIAMPVVFATSVLFLAALTYLLLRRFFNPQVRYISLPADYFALFLLLGIGLSGFTVRHLVKTDVADVKALALGLASFAPIVPRGLSAVFYGHLMLVCTLLAYFPFSKLVHMPGIFLSPTRNLTANSRAVRHVNPWDYPVKVHTYEEYEDELRDKMMAAGIPVERT